MRRTFPATAFVSTFTLEEDLPHILMVTQIHPQVMIHLVILTIPLHLVIHHVSVGITVEQQLFNEHNYLKELPNFSSLSHEVNSQKNSDILSNLVLYYIGQMFMEEDRDDKFDMLERNPALKPLKNPFPIISEKFTPSLGHPPLNSNSNFEILESHWSNNICSSSITDNFVESLLMF
ncbi:hypothetical protein KFK09_004820 [Dendrobium nobile]|uniref:Uncharacterized protein n=1 Tax=Dendrobium nobile TaxID=94219 RepID=A0A8T3BWL9_DENNO|nr:hypothetical protein KFK09_004820 [Dendrobium nobile]